MDPKPPKVTKKPPKKPKTRVLGRDTLGEIRNDMKRQTKPSWITSSPPHPGEKKWGKFSADQWRSFCLYNLPVTLIRLWGDFPPDSKERQQLDNYMHLVSAIKLATMRTMTPARVEQYEYHMHAYLTTLLDLYPRTQITPYQHMSLHFGRQLREFGPTHAWRCFAFERYNYVLQNAPTNNIPSELSTSLLSNYEFHT